MSRSNSAKTASMPARARPLGVVRSNSSPSEMKPTRSAVNSWSVATRSTSERRPRDGGQDGPGVVSVVAFGECDREVEVGQAIETAWEAIGVADVTEAVPPGQISGDLASLDGDPVDPAWNTAGPGTVRAW